jgi:hypothetical protein
MNGRYIYIKLGMKISPFQGLWRIRRNFLTVILFSSSSKNTITDITMFANPALYVPFAPLEIFLILLNFL